MPLSTEDADPRDFSRPAASLAGLVVRRDDAPQPDAKNAQAGDLTEDLAKRRGSAEPRNDAAPQNSHEPSAERTVAAESPSELQQPPPVAVQNAEPGDGEAAPASDEPSTEAAGAEEEVEAEAETAQTSVSGTDLRRKIMDAAAGGDDPESDDDGDDDGSPLAQDDSAAEPDAKPESGLWRSKKKQSETLLKSRMAAMLEKENRRREEWQARRGERPAAEAPAPFVAPRPQTVINGDILRYWTSCRRGRMFPPLSAMDQEEIARHWPDSLLLRFTAGSNHLELARNFAKGSPDGESGNTPSFRRIDFSPSVIDWVVSQGLAAAYEENPLRATEEFDTHWGTGRYKVIALPLAEDGRTIDHILCHLEPAGPND